MLICDHNVKHICLSLFWRVYSVPAYVHICMPGIRNVKYNIKYGGEKEERHATLKYVLDSWEAHRCEISCVCVSMCTEVRFRNPRNSK